MSRADDLAARLADADDAGAYFVSEDDADAMLDAARALGFAVARVDLGDATTKAGVLARIAAALAFPDWFGHNWDALADALGDLSWSPPAPGRVLLLEHAAAWRDAEPDEFDTLLAVLDEAAFDWADRGVPLWSLLPVPPGDLEEDEVVDDDGDGDV